MDKCFGRRRHLTLINAHFCYKLIKGMPAEGRLFFSAAHAVAKNIYKLNLLGRYAQGLIHKMWSLLLTVSLDTDTSDGQTP